MLEEFEFLVRNSKRLFFTHCLCEIVSEKYVHQFLMFILRNSKNTNRYH